MLQLNRKDVAQVDLGDVLPMFQRVFKDFVASTVSKCFTCFLNDVAIVLIWMFSYASHKCCNNTFEMFQLLQSHVAVVVPCYCKCFYFECCFICFIPVLQ